MNIFILDKDPKLAAKYHCDKHVIKMIIESAQLLSSAHWMNNSVPPYKLTHAKHPCSLWTRACLENYNWLVELGLELCHEYTFRYGKIHKTQNVMEWLYNNKPPISPIGHITNYPLSMPDYCRIDGDAVSSYRKYYISEKRDFCTWKNRDVPEWFK